MSQKAKVLLIQPNSVMESENKTYVGAQYKEAVSLGYLAASLERDGYFTEILNGASSLEDVLAAVEEHRPLALGFCVYTSTISTVLLFAQKAKEKSNELGFSLYTILGGYHCSAFPEEVVKNTCVDFVVKGEGDITICDLVKTLEAQEDVQKVDGIYYRKEGDVIRTNPRARITDLDILPWPKRYEKFMYQPRIETNNLTFPAYSVGGHFGKLIYSRGCPFACSFCSSRNTWGAQVYFRSPKDVVDEIEDIVEKYNVNSIGFMDLTFNANKKKVIALCDEIIKRNPPVYSAAMVRLDLFDEEMLEALAKANFVKFAVGFESPLTEISTKIKDEYAMKQRHIQKILSIANNLGFIIRAFMIIGFPYETQEMIKSYPDKLNTYDIDELRITIATPFPGTALWADCKKNNLLPEKIIWSNYTTEKLVFNHPILSNKDIMMLREELVTSFYFNEGYLRRIDKKIQKFPRLKDSWIEYFKKIKDENLLPKHTETLTRFLDSLKNIQC